MYSSKWKMQTSIRQFDMYTNNFLWRERFLTRKVSQFIEEENKMI